MLSSETAVEKLYAFGRGFQQYVKEKEYEKAKELYNQAVIVAVFLDIPEDIKTELFGGYAGDYEEEETVPEGLFTRWAVEKVNLECCIKRHMGHEDIACRKQGQAVEYYSDKKYCARCIGQRR